MWQREPAKLNTTHLSQALVQQFLFNITLHIQDIYTKKGNTRFKVVNIMLY